MEEKRFFLAFAITIALTLVYFQLTATHSKAVTPSAATEYKQKDSETVPSPTGTAEVMIAPSLAPTEQTTMDDFVVTYYKRGGYIKSLRSIAYDEELPFYNIGLEPETKDIEYTVKNERNKLVFSTPAGQRKTFVFDGQKLQIVSIPQQSKTMLLFSNTFPTNSLDQQYDEFFYAGTGTFERKKFLNVIPQPGFFAKIFQGAQAPADISLENIKFAGMRNRYFCFSLIEGKYAIKWAQNPQNKETFLYLREPAESVTLYVGLQQKEKMQPFGIQGVIYYGTFHGIGVLLLKTLYFLARIAHNWGVAVMLFGVFTYLLFFPLTKKSTQAMKEMREFQEAHGKEISNLRTKYANNPQKIHQETLELYKKHNFSPFKGCSSGCLPLLLQLPLIWAFWAVVPRILELRNANFLWIKDLSTTDRLFTLPFSLPLGIGNAVNLLPIATALLMFLQMRLTNMPTDPEQAQQQKIMGTIFPVMLIFILYNMPSALLLYWFVQSILTFISQWKMMRP
jgi:YidC/Oxa1 family membrane protein insertase